MYRYSSLAAGIGSGIASSLVVAPLDLVRTRLQVFHHAAATAKGAGGATANASARVVVPQTAYAMLRTILQREGVTGCFRGLTATLLTVPVFWGVYCAFQLAVVCVSVCLCVCLCVCVCFVSSSSAIRLYSLLLLMEF